MGRMTSVLLPVRDRYNKLTPDSRYQFRRLCRNLRKWYGYISQVVRMFDADLHKEYVFVSYLFDLLPENPVDMLDLEGKLKLETERDGTRLKAGDTVSVVEETSRGYFVKHNGVSGWYFGALSEE